MAQKKKSKQTGTVPFRKVIWLSIAASVLLLITNSAVWINSQIFNAENFTRSVTTSLTSESSRNAIATQITDKMFEQKPVAKRIAGDFSIKLLSGLLGTEQFNKVLTTAVERMQVYVTSSDQETVSIDLNGVKDIITRITNVSETLGKDLTIDASNIPNEIIILNEEDVPDVYGVVVAFLWIAPVTGIGALVLLAYPYLKKKYDAKKVLLTQSFVIMFASLLGLLAGPLFKPPILSTIKEPNGRVVVGNLYDTFIATFNNQTMYLFLIGLCTLLISVVWYLYPTIKQLVSKRS